VVGERNANEAGGNQKRQAGVSHKKKKKKADLPKYRGEKKGGSRTGTAHDFGRQTYGEALDEHDAGSSAQVAKHRELAIIVKDSDRRSRRRSTRCATPEPALLPARM